MTEKRNIHHLTFVTKYSRIPSEEIALKRYNAVMETWREPLLFDSNECELIGNALIDQAKKLWITIVVGNILPDHVHIVIYNTDKPTSEIIQKLKGYSSYIYNHVLQHEGPVWARWYSDMCIEDKEYFENAVKYIKNNHIKHKSQVYYLL